MLLGHFTTSHGTFPARLYDEPPATVANFTGLAEGTKEWTDPRTGKKVKQPYYNGTIFNRVIDGFMIQGGDPLGQGRCGTRRRASCRWRTAVRTPTAVSSSSRWRRPRGSTTSTASSAKSSKGWTS